MKLESARALKAQLFARDLEPLLAPKIANFSLAAGALDTVSKPS